MDLTSNSPVSSIGAFPHAQPAADTSAPCTAQPPTSQKGSWLPFTFRWYFLLVPITTTATLGIAISLLVWYSQHHYGIGADNGSSTVLFGWRFTPTLLAVLYTQTTVILFEDAKRTEPFTRLAQAPLDGASAYGTVLQTPRAWWAIFLDSVFRRKSVGRTSWCLVCTALINVVALLAISPLSSALLTSEEVVITKAFDISRNVPRAGFQLPIVANRETYFRTMSSLMRNLSTSAWIKDTSITFPFWPSTDAAQLGPNLVSRFSSWASETTIIYADLECQDMALESANLEPKGYKAYDVMGHGPYKGTESMVAFVLTSDDGCRYEMTVHPGVNLALNGGLTWSKTSTFYVESEVLPIGRMPFPANVSSTSPYARHNASRECADRDIIILNTPWTKIFKVEMNAAAGSGLELNRTYERSPDFRMKALLCQSQYSLENRNVTTSIGHGKEPNITSTRFEHIHREPITKALIDIPKFESITLRDTWKDYFNAASVATDANRALGGYEGPYSNPNMTTPVPGFFGLGPLLGALYTFNVTRMLDDKAFAAEAGRVKGRFFAECLREILSDPDATDISVTKGEVTMTEERIVVLRDIGIALAVLFLVSFLLLVMVLWVSRLSFRPLDLSIDPGSSIGHAMLLRSQLERSSTFWDGHRVGSSEFHQTLRNDTFYMQNGRLHTASSGDHTTTPASAISRSSSCRQPLVIRLRMLFFLSCFLILILVAILVLNAFSARSRLSQLAFIYQADVSSLGLSFSTFAPISIAPTVVSIAISLWWDQLDSTFRIFQPYIAMSRRPTPISNGAGLTYRSKTWIGAAIKAARNKHWMLFLVAIGSVLCQILTVSMSALFERQAANVSDHATLERTLRLRQIPIVTTVKTSESRLRRPHPALPPFEVLDNLLLDPPRSWLPGAAIQLSLNGTKPSWTQDGWSFLPLDLASILQSNAKTSISSPNNVTVTTSALRARLECEKVPEVANISTWLTHSNDIQSLGGSYELKGLKNYYSFNHTMFDDTPSNTSAFATGALLRCCSNETNGDSETAVIGYWSPVDVENFPNTDSQWPIPFVTKWIVGRPLTVTGLDQDDEQMLLFKDAPDLQAARCIPIIETADAKVIVDEGAGTVHSYQIIGSVDPAQSAWSEVFVRHALTYGNATQRYDETYDGPLNVTTSYGVLFMGSMFKAADPNIGPTGTSYAESLHDNAFVMRDPEIGINMDLMTYSMYSLAKKDPQALLDYATLVAYADQTFQTFFQHFISHGLSLDKGGLGYQRIGDNSTDILGAPVAWNGRALPQREYVESTTNRTVEALVSRRIQVLHMNSIATYLSVAIIIWLVGTTAVVSCLQRKYTSSMIRDVQLIADVLVLVAGSDQLFRLVEERGVELKKANDVKAMLGWFKDRNGEERWGIEVVGGSGAVEWVDAPKTVQHVQSYSKRHWFPWRGAKS